MTDPATQESYPVPDPTIVDPCPATVQNGQCAPDGFTNNHHQLSKTPSQPEALNTGQEMKITDSVEGEGNFINLCLVFKSYGCACMRMCWEAKLMGGVFLPVGGIFSPLSFE